MMKKWIPVAMALLLGACSSSNQKNYYQLPVLSTPAATSAATVSPRQLWVEHIALADYLAGSGLVYQTSDVQYVLGSNNLWASPLEQQLQQQLVTNLGAALPDWVVSAQPMGSEQDVLNVNISGFHGRYDGKVILRGEWVLNRQGQLIKRPFNLEIAQTEDGYDALVRTLAQGWLQEAQQIAATVQ